jgi:hypothetical protein
MRLEVGKARVKAVVRAIGAAGNDSERPENQDHKKEKEREDGITNEENGREPPQRNCSIMKRKTCGMSVGV